MTPAPLLTSGQVARRLGLAPALVRKALRDGRASPTLRARKQGARSGWTEDDVALFALALVCARELRTLAKGLHEHVRKLRGADAALLAVGPGGGRLTRQADARRLLAQLGTPLGILARTRDFRLAVTR